MVSKVFEKLVNNRFVDHLEKCDLFSDFQYGFRSSQSTADLLTVVSHKIARAFNRSGATRAVALDISKAFDRVWHAGLLHICLMEFQFRYLALFFLLLVIGNFGWFWMENPHKNIKLMLEFLKGPFLVLHFSYYTLMTFPMLSVILLKCDQTSDWWQQLELASELESNLRDTVDWDRKWLVDFNAGKTQLVSFDQSKNTGAIDMRIDVSVLEEKSSFKMLELGLLHCFYC